MISDLAILSCCLREMSMADSGEEMRVVAVVVEEEEREREGEGREGEGEEEREEDGERIKIVDVSCSIVLGWFGIG
jgi:hypothetical protein